METPKIDRSQFKATSVAETVQADEQIDAMTNTKKGTADYLDIKSGTGEHKYRIYPPHPDDGGKLYAVPKAVHWIPKQMPKKDDKGNYIKDDKDKLILEWREGPIFNARVHGNQEKDLIEEYAAFAKKIAEETIFDSSEKKKDEDLRKAFLEPVIGSPRNFTPGAPKPKHSGIIPLRQTWVMYAHELIETFDSDKKPKLIKKFGRLEIGKSVKDRLNKISASESSSEPLGTDPYTNLDEGRAIKIKYDAVAGKKNANDYYSTELYAPVIAGSGGRITLYPITDEDLIHFGTQTSLQKMFVNCYDTKTFQQVLEGLKYFDDKNEIGVFGYEEFMDIADKILSTLPQAEEKVTSEEGVSEVSGDQFDKMDRDELKEYNKENKLGIIINKTMDDNKVRSLIREALEIKNPTVKKEETTTSEETGGPATGETGSLPFTPDTNTGTEIKKEDTPVINSKVNERLNKLKNAPKKD